MNIQQLKYVVAIAKYGSFREASKKLYVAQSSLSSAIKELEKELTIEIFLRSQRGIQLTETGADFLEHATRILSEVTIVENRYQNKPYKKFSVSSQHYDFASEAFSKILMQYEHVYEEFSFFETNTFQVLQDVKHFKSEVGILYLNEKNKKVILQHIKDYHLIFTPLGNFQPHVFLRCSHPLGKKETIRSEDLQPYPLIQFSQKKNSVQHFSEDILEPCKEQTLVYASDRGTVVNLLNTTDCCLVGSGILRSPVKKQLAVIPLDIQLTNTIGWIQHENRKLTPIAKDYVELLQSLIS